jgi:DNA-binding protein
MATKKIIPLAAMERLMKNAGADRVSEDAKAALRDVLEEFGEEVAIAANKFAIHAKRKTVKAEDIKLASR